MNIEDRKELHEKLVAFVRDNEHELDQADLLPEMQDAISNSEFYIESEEGAPVMDGEQFKLSREQMGIKLGALS